MWTLHRRVASCGCWCVLLSIFFSQIKNAPPRRRCRCSLFFFFFFCNVVRCARYSTAAFLHFSLFGIACAFVLSFVLFVRRSHEPCCELVHGTQQYAKCLQASVVTFYFVVSFRWFLLFFHLIPDKGCAPGQHNRIHRWRGAVPDCRRHHRSQEGHAPPLDPGRAEHLRRHRPPRHRRGLRREIIKNKCYGEWRMATAGMIV